MSSYCAVCRELFDFPHHHCPASGNTWDGVCSTTSPFRKMFSLPPTHLRCRSSGGSSHPQQHQGKRLSSTRRRAASSSSSQVSLAIVQEAASRRRAPSTPSAVGAERDTVNSLLRMSPSARGSALVRTPSRCQASQKRNSVEKSSRRRVSNERDANGFHHRHYHHRRQRQKRRLLADYVQPSAKGNVSQEQMTQHLDHLQATLERIREAVRRDKGHDGIHNKNSENATVSRGDDNDSGVDSGFGDASGCGDSGGEGFSDDVEHPESSGVFLSVDDADGEMSTDAPRCSDHAVLPWSSGVRSAAPPLSTALCGDEGLAFPTGRPKASSLPLGGTDTSSPYRPGHSSTSPPPALLPASHRSLRDTAIQEGASSATTRFSAMRTRNSQEGALPQFHSLVRCTEGVNSKNGNTKRGSISRDGATPCKRDDFMLVHLETLRSGFVELCSAVREDLHALHTRVNDLQKQTQQQMTRSDGVTLNQTVGAHHENSGAAIEPPISYDGLLAELQQYTLSTVHKVLLQQQKQQQQQVERVVSARDTSAAGSGHEVPFSSFPVPPWLGSAETFDMYLRSAVRAVLHEDDFQREMQAVLGRQQRDHRRDLKASKREWRRQCALLENQLTLLAETLESTRVDMEEVRMQRLSPPPPPPRTSVTPAGGGTATTSAAAAAAMEHQLQKLRGGGHAPSASANTPTAASVAPEFWEDRVMQRVERLLAESEERHLHRVRMEVMQPLLEHVHRLMSAHQSMIDTVVESRCAQFEAYVDRGRHVWDMQVTDLRSRVSTLRGGVHRALQDLSENLGVACPGL